MRLGILGPAQGDLVALARGAQQLVDEGSAEKVIYVADDDALDQVVANWARGLVGEDPGGTGLFERAASRCATASPDEIEEFVASERARLRLQVFVSLPKEGRTIEFLDGRVVLFVHDKATLDEDDIAGASILVFGKSDKPLIKKVGARTFLSPGPVGAAAGGRAILDDAGGGVRIEMLNEAGTLFSEEIATTAARASLKMRVQGGSTE